MTSENTASAAEQAVKNFISKVASVTNLPEPTVAKALGAIFVVLCIGITYLYFSRDKFLECDNITAIATVKKIVKDSNFFLEKRVVEVNAIRLVERNKTYNRTTCAAQFVVFNDGIPNPGFGITYTLERTTDGQLFVNVSGLPWK